MSQYVHGPALPMGESNNLWLYWKLKFGQHMNQKQKKKKFSMQNFGFLYGVSHPGRCGGWESVQFYSRCVRKGKCGAQSPKTVHRIYNFSRDKVSWTGSELGPYTCSLPSDHLAHLAHTRLRLDDCLSNTCRVSHWEFCWDWLPGWGMGYFWIFHYEYFLL